jgi:hypothetical protein
MGGSSSSILRRGTRMSNSKGFIHAPRCDQLSTQFLFAPNMPDFTSVIAHTGIRWTQTQRQAARWLKLVIV